jgi:hypothetical protein
MSLSNESIPKSVSRVLNAVQIREEFHKRRKASQGDEDAGSKRKKKRRRVDGGEDGKNSKSLRILPGESLGHFNKLSLVPRLVVLFLGEYSLSIGC